MVTTYIAVTVVAAIVMASAAGLSLLQHNSVLAAADVVEVPRSWMPRLGVLLGGQVQSD